MAFNKIIKICVGIVILINFGCTKINEPEGQYVIGSRLDSISSLSDQENENYISFFDQKIRKIHLFEAQNLKLAQSFDVQNPEEDHYIIANNDQNFLVDLSRSQLTIYKYDGSQIKDPIKFNGKPLSAAYDKNQGFLVIYDDLYSVGILKLSPQGNVIDSWVGGYIIDNDKSIVAGDINTNGELLLVLSDGTLSIVDLEQSVTSKSWVQNSINASLDLTKWVGVVSNAHILVQTQQKLILYNYQTSTLDAELNTEDYDVQLYSSLNDAHIIFQNKFNGHFMLAFFDGVELRNRQMTTIESNQIILQSVLDQSKNIWSNVTAIKNKYRSYYGSAYINLTYSSRLAKTYRFNDMLNLSSKDLPYQAQLKQATNYVFALFPSELGYAQKISLETEELKVLELFNIPYVK